MLIILFSEKRRERKDDWEEGKTQRKMLIVSQSWKIEFASKMTLFILIIMEDSNETTWLIVTPPSWADWETFFSRFMTASISSLPDHTLFTYSSLHVYFSLIFWLLLIPSPSLALSPHCCCLSCCLASSFSLPHSLFLSDSLPPLARTLGLISAGESWFVGHVCA